MQSRLFMLALACVAVTGCSRGVVSRDDLPTAPSQQAPRATRLTITPLGGGNILVGGSVPVATSGGRPSNGAALGAFAEYNNGQGRYVEAAWSSTDESIVAVVNNTLVARRRGSATLTASFEGLNDSEDFVVDGGFWGSWSGSYVVDRCNASSGSLQDVLCRAPAGGRSGVAPAGATLPFAIEIPEATGEDISARVSLGNISGVLAGKNRGGGYFWLLGDIRGQGSTISIVEWNVRASQDVMEGAVLYQVTIDGLPGVGAVALKLTDVKRQ